MITRLTALRADELCDAATEVAATEGVEGLLVFVTDGGAAVVQDSLSTFRDFSVPVFGGVFPTLVHDGQTVEDGALVFGLPTRPTVTEVTDLSDPTADLSAQLDPSLLDTENQTAFVFVDSYADRIGDMIRSLFDTYGVEFNFIGGGTGTLSDEEHPSLFTESGLHTDAAVIATVPLSSSIGVNHGWKDIDGPFRVTEADGTTMKSLDGEPAFQVYKRVLTSEADVDIDRANFFETAKAYPFGLSRMGTEPIVRDPYTVNNDGSMECFGEIPTGEYVHILHGDSQELVDAAGAAATTAIDGPTDSTAGDNTDTSSSEEEALLTFDCISRVLYLNDDFERELEAIGANGHRLHGALSIGEVANDGHGHLEYFNKTTVVASLSNE
ncbi:FIST signal transduction protein [Halobaculum sp. MBLA0147]|uniref:FIST signal transduction protein n=1 Tax=Halobaculum sp. MBLA0147 TaxID=3079934 RepID=UPI003523AA2C